MLELALNREKDITHLKDIAERQKMPARYLGHLLLILKSAKLVASTRGARGGYRLTRHPSEITLSEIVQTLEGTLAPSQCVDDPGTCPRSAFCAAHEVWREMKISTEEILLSYTLQDLVDRHRNKRSLKGEMRYVL